MAALSPLAVLSGALKVTDKCTVAMEAVGDISFDVGPSSRNDAFEFVRTKSPGAKPPL